MRARSTVCLRLWAPENAAPQQAWAKVLDAEFESIEFARRHAAVVGLYGGTLQQVMSLPERSRERLERYAWSWWVAVMAPQHPWSRPVTMSSTVDPGALDQLGSAADLIEARMKGSLAVPAKTNLDDLRAVCQEWIDTVKDETDLAESLRVNLMQDLHHIMWLIEHADLFGVARVAVAGQKIIGNVITVGSTLPPAKHGPWAASVKKLVAAVVMLGALHAGVDAGLALAEGATGLVAELTSGPDAVPATPGPVGSGEDGGAGRT